MSIITLIFHMIDFNKFVKGDSLKITKEQTKDVRVDIKELVSFLQSNTHIEKLSLIGLNIDNESAKDLANLSNLVKLNLRNNDISDEGAIALAKGNFLKLTSLDLSCNKISDKGVEDLAKFSTLTSLDLSHNEISDKGIGELAKLSKLTSLNLSSNKIGSQGVKALAEFSELTSLELYRNKIGNQGAEVLAKLSKLTFLNLSDNIVKSEGAKALAEGNFKKIKLLNLADNKIDDQGVEAFTEALKNGRFPELTSVYLGSYNITEKYKKDFLASHKNLTSCDLRDTLKRKSSLEPEASSNQSPKKLKSDGTNNQEMKQQAAQLLSETQSNRGQRRRSPLLRFLCCEGSSSPYNSQLGPSSELDEVLAASSSRELDSLNSNNIEMVSKSQSR